MSDIRDKVTGMETQIDSDEDTDPAYFNDTIRGLVHRVFYAHGAIERGIEDLIIGLIIPGEPGLKPDEIPNEIIEQRLKLLELLQEMDFYRKLEFAKSKGLLSGKAQEKFIIVNRIRNDFAHPDHYDMKKYSDETLRNGILEKLLEGLKTLHGLFNHFANPV